MILWERIIWCEIRRRCHYLHGNLNGLEAIFESVFCGNEWGYVISVRRKFESIFIKQLLCGFNGPILHLKCSRSFPIYDRMQRLPPPLLLLLWLFILFKRGAFHVPMSNKFKYLKQNEYLNFQIPFLSCFVRRFQFQRFLCSMCVCARMCDFAADNNYVIFVIYHRFAPNCNSNWSITRMIKHFSYVVLTVCRFVLWNISETYKKAYDVEIKTNKLTTHLLGYWWLPFSSFHSLCWRSKVKLFQLSFSFWSFQIVKFTIDRFSLTPHS